MTDQERVSGKIVEVELIPEAENWLLAEQIGVSIFDLRLLTVEEIEAKQGIEEGRRKHKNEREKIQEVTDKAKRELAKRKHGH